MQQRNQTSSRDETLSAYLASEQRLYGVHPEESETEASLEHHPKSTNGKAKVIAALIALSLTLSVAASVVVPSFREPIVHMASVVRSVRHINDDPNVHKEVAANINAIARNTKVPARVRVAALTILPWNSGKTPVAGTKREISPIWERLSEISRENPSGYALDPDSLPADDVEVTQINLNDGTVEGLRHRHLPVFSIQYHPEASPGPHDSNQYFDQFVSSMEAAKG
jgi:hypothetical protein